MHIRRTDKLLYEAKLIPSYVFWRSMLKGEWLKVWGMKEMKSSKFTLHPRMPKFYLSSGKNSNVGNLWAVNLWMGQVRRNRVPGLRTYFLSFGTFGFHCDYVDFFLGTFSSNVNIMHPFRPQGTKRITEWALATLEFLFVSLPLPQKWRFMEVSSIHFPYGETTCIIVLHVSRTSYHIVHPRPALTLTTFPLYLWPNLPLAFPST